jgi:uncharacterized protein YdaU (DUF1376 family)
MAAIPYMPLYVADYLGDAGHLTTAQHGAYLLLLMNYWQRGKGLPANDAALMSITRMSKAEWEKTRPAVLEFFTEVDGVLVNNRSEKELARFRDKSTQSARAANVRWESVRNASDGNAGAMRAHIPTQCHTDTDTSKNKTPISPLPKKRQRDPDESRGQRFTGPATLAECPTEWAAFCKGLGWSFGRACIEYQNFVDYWSSVPGAKGRKLDWLGTWRVRCRDQNKKDPAKPAHDPLPPVKFWVDDLLDPK